MNAKVTNVVAQWSVWYEKNPADSSLLALGRKVCSLKDAVTGVTKS